MRFTRICSTFLLLLNIFHKLNALRVSDETMVKLGNDVTAAMAETNENGKKLTCSLVKKKMFTFIEGKCQILLQHAKEALNNKCLTLNNNVLYDNLDKIPKQLTISYLLKNYEQLGNMKLNLTDPDLINSIPACQIDTKSEFATALIDSLFAAWDTEERAMKMRQKNNQPIIMMPKRMFHLNNMLRCEINMDLLISEVEKYKVQMPQSAVNEKLYSGVVQNENKLGTEALQEILIEMKNNKETLYVTDQRQIDKRISMCNLISELKKSMIADAVAKSWIDAIAKASMDPKHKCPGEGHDRMFTGINGHMCKISAKVLRKKFKQCNLRVPQFLILPNYGIDESQKLDDEIFEIVLNEMEQKGQEYFDLTKFKFIHQIPECNPPVQNHQIQLNAGNVFANEFFSQECACDKKFSTKKLFLYDQKIHGCKINKEQMFEAIEKCRIKTVEYWTIGRSEVHLDNVALIKEKLSEIYAQILAYNEGIFVNGVVKTIFNSLDMKACKSLDNGIFQLDNGPKSGEGKIKAMFSINIDELENGLKEENSEKCHFELNMPAVLPFIQKLMKISPTAKSLFENRENGFTRIKKQEVVEILKKLKDEGGQLQVTDDKLNTKIAEWKILKNVEKLATENGGNLKAPVSMQIHQTVAVEESGKLNADTAADGNKGNVEDSNASDSNSGHANLSKDEEHNSLAIVGQNQTDVDKGNETIEVKFAIPKHDKNMQNPSTKENSVPVHRYLSAESLARASKISLAKVTGPRRHKSSHIGQSMGMMNGPMQVPVYG